MDITKHIAYQINQQFPSIYREDGEELVDFVKSYYTFLEADLVGFYVSGYVISNEIKSYFARKFITQAEAQVYHDSLDNTYLDKKITKTKNQIYIIIFKKTTIMINIGMRPASK